MRITNTRLFVVGCFAILAWMIVYWAVVGIAGMVG